VVEGNGKSSSCVSRAVRVVATAIGADHVKLLSRRTIHLSSLAVRSRLWLVLFCMTLKSKTSVRMESIGTPREGPFHETLPLFMRPTVVMCRRESNRKCWMSISCP
jgi:hypothetical protein